MASRGKSTPQVHQIKAIFEGFRDGRSRSSERSPKAISHHTIKSTDRLAPRSEGADTALLSDHPAADDTESIESVITDAHLLVPTPARPTLSAKPSWIGPSRESTPRPDRNMSRRVTITYSAPGLRPPVYITTSLSEPAWDIIEMPFVKKPHGDVLFHIDFDAGEGEYQYKFRLGPGDWWVCDSSKPIIDDGFGNQNNVLSVESGDAASHLSKVDSVHDVGHALKIGDVSVRDDGRKSLQARVTDPVDGHPQASSHSNTETLVDPPVQIIAANADHANGRTQHAPASFDFDTDTEDDEPAPLLRHETNSPDQHERQSYISPVISPSKSISSRSSFEDVFCPEADPNDPSLYHFPTHHEGIISEIKRTHRNMPEDKTNGAHDVSSPTRKSNGASNLSLPSVAEAYEEVNSSESESQSKANSKRWFDHSHTPARHHAHHRKSSGTTSKPELTEKPQIAQLERRGVLGNILEPMLGITLAVIVAVIAMTLYSSGLLGSHINVKDGGAVLHD